MDEDTVHADLESSHDWPPDDWAEGWPAENWDEMHLWEAWDAEGRR